MFRVSRRAIKASSSLLLGTFLLFVYHCMDFSELNRIYLQENNTSQLRPHTKNNSYVYSWPKCQQNVSAANILDFSSLSANTQDFLYYRHCRHFPMLLDLPDKCEGAGESADIFLLLVIKSSPVNYDRRAVLRKTWAKERLHNGVWIRRIFISGTMESGLEKERLNVLLKLEQREYNDILQWDFDDSFFNLTLKQTLLFEWIERNCQQARFLFNGDDDVFANTDNMVVYLQGLMDNNGSKHLYTGNMLTNTSPVRFSGSKYFVPVQVHSENLYPPYCGGGGFILSSYTSSVIYNMSQSITLMPIDDVYIGMCLAKAGLAPSFHKGMRTLGWHIPSKKRDQYDPCYFREHLLIHRFLPADIYAMWHRIHDPNLKCGRSMTRFEERQTVDNWW